jgi:aldehyde:ferredoxin oxidoreductase
MEPLPSGPGEGQIFEEKPLLEQYYKARGWDTKTGIPNSEKLRDLGLHLNFEKT